ncbi:hypothetical protein XENTR_v10006083 [Xenopus tropicalis]|nr:hypothetical protein XENTR_v10006083 [Xenopus tropicalis]
MMYNINVVLESLSAEDFTIYTLKNNKNNICFFLIKLAGNIDYTSRIWRN